MVTRTRLFSRSASTAELAGLALLFLSLCACGDSEPEEGSDACAQVLEESCQPQYSPEYDLIFNRTLVSSCGVAGGSCHATEGAQAGLVFAEADASYDYLTGAGALVVPGDPACSTIVKRLEAPELARAMPPGSRLSEGERCAIEAWIRNGAER